MTKRTEVEWAEKFKNIALARGAIVETGMLAGKIKCPVCLTGDLHFRVAKSNRHVHAQCFKGEARNGDCVGWME